MGGRGARRRRVEGRIGARIEATKAPTGMGMERGRGGSSPNILGEGHCPHQPLHYRVHFLRSPFPETEKIRTSYRPTFEIYH